MDPVLLVAFFVLGVLGAWAKSLSKPKTPKPPVEDKPL